MTLLIDPPNAPGHGRMWSHLASDASFDELHRFAARLGIPERGFDRDHYDIPAERYDAVVAAGAVPVSSRELIARLRAAGLRRRKSDSLTPKASGRPLIRAQRLRPGARVVVVAPSGPVPAGRLDAGLEVLRSWGLEVDVARHTRAVHRSLPYLAADDASRADDFMRAWCTPEVDAVFCARGGFGAQRIVDLLDWPALAEAGPKVLVGFSDVTALHQAFFSRLGLSTVHGPVVAGLPEDDDSSHHLRTMLMDPEKALSLTPDPCDTVVPGDAEGVLVGGNLAVLATSIGTRGTAGAAGAIAVLEDTSEEIYRVDRLLTQLLRSGWFDGVRGVVLGQFTDCDEPEAVDALLAERLSPLGVPILRRAPFGHEKRNLAFPFGVPARLDGEARSVTLSRPALL